MKKQTFDLVANMKKKNFQMSEEEENLMKGIELEIADFIKDQQNLIRNMNIHMPDVKSLAANG